MSGYLFTFSNFFNKDFDFKSHRAASERPVAVVATRREKVEAVVAVSPGPINLTSPSFLTTLLSKFSIPLSVRGDWQPKDLWSDAKILEMTTENLAVVSPSPTDRQRRLDAAQNPKRNPIISEAYGRKERDCCCLQSQCQSGWRITIGVSLFTSLHPLPSPQTCATGWINRVKEINI